MSRTDIHALIQLLEDPDEVIFNTVRDAITWSDESPIPPMAELYHDVFVEPWGPYTGSSQPAMNGGTANQPSMRTIDTKEELS